MSSRHTTVETVLGPLVLTAVDAVTGVYFPHHRHPPDTDRLGAEVALPTRSGGDAFPATENVLF